MELMRHFPTRFDSLHPLRMNPPNEKTCSPVLSLISSMPEIPPFVVRLLPSTSLDGAFRVHLSPEALEKLGLKVGELCHITGENGETGYGIAWRATDKMGNNPKLRPAKMTDMLRTAFSFREGSQVTIAKTSARIAHADKVTLSDITPSDYGNDAEPEKWLWRCGSSLNNCEAIATGITFDVHAGKGLRKRFCVDHVESTGTSGPALFFFDGKTQLAMADDAPPVETTALPNGDSFPVLDISLIGGLVDQAKELNMRLDLILSNATLRNGQVSNRHVLLHGYEGTGKTMLLQRLQKTRLCKVFNIDKSDIPSGKVQSTIQSVFTEALARQPSIVIIDNLEELAGNDNKLYKKTLAKQMTAVCGARVLVIAATRVVTDIDTEVIGPNVFEKQIELPIPDINARKQILNILTDKPFLADDRVTNAVSAKTHGFTGKDLTLLVKAAGECALLRHLDEQRQWVHIGAQVPDVSGHNRTDTMLDGSVYSQATTAADNATLQPSPTTPDLASAEQLGPALTLEDFITALQEVHPTALREVFLEKPSVRWSDIGGSDAIKQRFDEIMGWPIHQADVLKLLRLGSPKGVLLYGPPGCSKTMTAQAVAATYDLNFIAVKGAELISMYVGESERAVREIFRKARQAAPCIVFFDEIDSIGSERESTGSKGLNVLTTLLTEMDGFEAMKDVLVLAATNKPEILDPALLRPGRFTSHVYVGLPVKEARKAIADIELLGIPIADDVDLEGFVNDTDGYSGAEIVGICEAAKVRVARRARGNVKDVEVCTDDLEEAIKSQRKGVTQEMLEGYEAFART